MLPLNGLGSINLILICGQFFLFANKTCAGVISGIVVIYTGIKINSMDSLACCSTIIVFFTKLKKINKYI